MMLEIVGVTKRFAGVTALADVSFRVGDGTIHAVIGPNGSGKTTLFNVVTGVYKPTAGEVRLDGVRLDGRDVFEIARRGVARTFQNPRIFGSMTVAEHLWVSGEVRGSPWRFSRLVRAKARERLAFVGLEALADHPAAGLPQGQRRLLEIARALMLDPRVLLLDEPHAGLNPVEKDRLMAVIQRLHEAGLTIMLVEHEMRVVMQLADRITVLNFGQVIAEGAPREIAADEAVVQAYLGRHREAVRHG
jgi:ABC-type branched-subunit amino acid transport system ATPase component